MRIANTNPSGVNPLAVSGEARAQRSQASSPGGPGPNSAQPQPALGASVVHLTALALGQPDVRAARVSALRSQVAAGAYTPQLHSTADKILADPLNGPPDGDGDGHG